MILLKFAFSLSKIFSAIACQLRRVLPLASFFFLVATGCATKPPVTDSPFQYFKGKAQVFDKKKNKEEWVYFSSTVRYPEQLRMDVSLGLLGIPLGTLVINGDEAKLISLVDKKVYVAAKGSQVLEKLMKTPISSQDIIAIFAEKLPLAKPWLCQGQTNQQNCQQASVQVDWKLLDGPERTMTLESPKSKVTMVYEPISSGKEKFDLPNPKGYEVITL